MDAESSPETMSKSIKSRIWFSVYKVIVGLLHPINLVFIRIFQKKVYANSVLHVSYMVHVPYHTTRILRKNGLKADYLANGTSQHWDKSDFQSPNSKNPIFQAVLEFILFWKVVARYESIHLHFCLTMSRSGWELQILKILGRQIVIHFRGCEARDYYKNIKMHPEMNICQQCDYGHYCISKENQDRIKKVTAFGDVFLVTTPDLKDFVPNAVHIPFFAPDLIPSKIENVEIVYPNRPLRLLHWTNHPGIEGTDLIRNSIDRLKEKGYEIEFIFLQGVPHSKVMLEIPKSDLTIGKMKMGYYANSQIEAMTLGIPTITWVRPELMTDELRNSGFIFSHIFGLDKTLEYYLKNPQALFKKREIARSSILKLHDNDKISEKYKLIYKRY